MTQGSPSFNLLDEPFIGVIQADDSRFREVGIRGLLTKAHEYERIHSDSPLEIVAISRLLLAILHCVHRSIDTDTWSGLWQRGSFDMKPIDDYLSQVIARFDLFSETHPFYQASDLAIPQDKLSPSQRLCLELTSGNNAVLFDHSHDDEPVAMTPGRAARALLATQAFAIGGGKSSGGLPNTTNAPLVGSTILMPKAQTVFESLMLGMLSDSEINDLFGCLGTAWWERPQGSLPHEENGAPDGYLDYLTWQSRAVLLNPETSSDAPQVRLISFAQGRGFDKSREDPFMAFSRKSHTDKWGPLRVRRNRELWRDSGSFLAISAPGANERRPRILEWLARLAIRGRLKNADRLRLFGTGFDNVDNKGKPNAKVHLWQQAELPLPVQLLDDASAVSAVRAGIEFAEAAQKALRQAVWVMAKWRLSPSAGDSASLSREAKGDIDAVVESINPSRRFWSAIEPLFDKFVHELTDDRDAAMEAWKHSLVKTTRDAFRAITNSGGSTARDLRAIAQAEKTLGFGLRGLKENSA